MSQSDQSDPDIQDVQGFILSELHEIRADQRWQREALEEVREVVRGWRGQLVKQGGLVAIAMVTALGQTCSSSESGAAPAPACSAPNGGAGGCGGSPEP